MAAKIKIVHLYPKELNLYGDTGNVLCLKRRIDARGIKCEITEVGAGGVIPDFDIMFIGGGQDREMNIILKDLRKKSEMIAYAAGLGKVILAICAGYQLLGEYYKTADGGIMKMSTASGHFLLTSAAPCTSMSSSTSIPAASFSRMVFRDVP